MRRPIHFIISLILLLAALPAVAQLPQQTITLDPSALTSGDPVQEKQQLARTLQGHRNKKDVHGEAITLLLIGLNEMRLNNLDGTRSSLNEAVTKLESQNDVIGAWMGLLILSHLESAVGNSDKGLAIIERALAMINTAKTSRAPFSLKTLKTFAAGSGLPDGTMEILEQNADLMKPMMLQYFLEPITRDLYGALLTEAGQFEKAEAELKAALAGSKYLQGMYDFSIYSHYGDLRFRQRNYGEARAHYQKALSSSAQMPMNPMGEQWLKAGIYDRLARLEIASRNPEEALKWNGKSLEVARSAGIPLQECVTLETRGQLLMRSERFTEAEAAFNDALKIAVAAKSVPRQAAIESHLGSMHMLNGKYGSAASRLEKAVQLYHSVNDPIAEAATWGTLANAYMLTGDLGAAENALSRARAIVDKVRFPLGSEMIAMAETWLKFRKGEATLADAEAGIDQFLKKARNGPIDFADEMEPILRHALKALQKGGSSTPKSKSGLPYGQIYLDVSRGLEQMAQGNAEEARRIWRETLSKTPSSDMRANILGMIAASYRKEGNAEQAAYWFTEAANALDAGADDLGPAGMSMPQDGYRRAFYDYLIESRVHSGQIEQAFEATERARARKFLRLLGNHRLKLPSGASQVVKEADELRRKIANWNNEPQDGEPLVDLRRRYEALMPRVQAAAAEYASLTTVSPLRLDEIRKQLTDDTTLISYFVSPVGSHAWVLDRQSLEHVRLNITAPQMRRVTCWAFELSMPRSGEYKYAGECGDREEAYRALIAPLRDKIRKSRLLIIPHGELHYVPFAALFDANRGNYLIEDYPISYAPSASTLRFLSEKDSPLTGGALVLGDPAAPAQSRLKGAQSEAQKVAAKFRTTAKVGKRARESLLFALPKNVDLLHIAAHASYDPISPLFSAIHLARGGNRNGDLNVDEIQAELDLSGVNLVVLSGCRTGVGARTGGDEIVGLTRAIVYAGSPAVISTLWDISDEATPPLIDKFYDRLLAGDSAADALRTAQTETLCDPKHADPRYWAAFLLTGDSTAWLKKRV